MRAQSGAAAMIGVVITGHQAQQALPGSVSRSQPQLDVLELSVTPGHLIRRAQQNHTSMWSHRLHAELTGPQYSVLAALAQESGIDQTRMAELASLDKNTAADIVRRLVTQGWIDRSLDDRDRRRRCLRLTASAKMALRYITPAAELVQQDLLAFIPVDAHSAMIEMLACVAYSRGSAPSPGISADVPVLQMSRTPGYLIRRIQQLHSSIWSQVVGPDVTGPQYAVLVAVAGEPGLDQVSLGLLSSLDSSSTADIVARLTRSGWIIRSTDRGDARRSTVMLSESATSQLGRISGRARLVQDELLAGLAPQCRKEFTRYLALIAYLGQPPRR